MVISEKVIRNWAHDSGDEEDFDDLKPLPASTCRFDGNTKIVTAFKYEDGKKYKIISYYKVERLKVSKDVANRKQWEKFGIAKNDAPGPNPANTFCCEDVAMQFISNKDEDNIDKDDLQNLTKNVVKCRYCELDHWTLKCPYKEKFLGKDNDDNPSGTIIEERKPGIKYIPPSARAGGDKETKKSDPLSNQRSKDDANTIRVTNLPEEILDSDIKELFQPFGLIRRIFLAKDKHTGHSKGFAFVSYERRDDAVKAIAHVNGFGYANLILNVEWAKPSAN